MKKPGRSGQYIQQLTGYKAFIPVALPSDPDIKTMTTSFARSPMPPTAKTPLSRIALIKPPMIGLMAPVGGAFLALEPGVKKGGFLSLFFVVFLP